MADDRWRNDQERNRYRDQGQGGLRGDRGQGFEGGSDYRGDGTIAQRGFGNERSGYDRGRGDEVRGGYGSEADHGRPRDAADRYGGGGAYGSDYRGAGAAGGREGRGSGGYGAESYGGSHRDYDRGASDRAYGPGDYETPGYGDWGMPHRRPGEARHDDMESRRRNEAYRDDDGSARHDRDQAYRELHDRGDGYIGRDRNYGFSGGEGRGFWRAAADEVTSWFTGDETDRSSSRHESGGSGHRGRGPKGYTRSDDRIREDVCERLTHDPFVDASDIEISVSNREVTLSGFVDSRDAKRRAEDCAEHVSGVSHVQNNLRVRQAGMTSGAGSLEGASSGGGLTSGTVSGIVGSAGSTGVEVNRTEGGTGRRKSGA